MFENPRYIIDPTGQLMIQVWIDGYDCFVPIDEQNGDYKELIRMEKAGEIVISPVEGENNAG